MKPKVTSSNYLAKVSHRETSAMSRLAAYSKISVSNLLCCLVVAILCVGCAMYALNSNNSMRLMRTKIIAMSQRTARLENRYRRNSEAIYKNSEKLAEKYPHLLSRRSSSNDDVQLTKTGKSRKLKIMSRT
ncbi:unnamed protein product [Clavelina lepadiformis]|uniref:Cell division protein FtsL n=1 Tax=Clavelina lepadiformis TaxID=159417 RepID=A0ABP0FKV5_CLALP